MRDKIGRRSAVAATSLALAAALVTPPVPAGATTAETCHPPRYDTVKCACEAMARALSPVIPPASWDCN